MTFLSPLPVWTWPLVALGGRLAYHLLKPLRKEIDVPAWPWCGRCSARRAVRIVIAAGVILTGLLSAVMLGERVRGQERLVSIAVIAIGLAAGIVLIARSNRSYLAGVRVSPDGLWLELPRAHPGFVEALRSQPMPRYPMPPGFTVPAEAALWQAPLPPARSAPEQPTQRSTHQPAEPPHGWASPSG
ncbi:hypothetical protein ACFO1B_38405 [Dactylosporangium siamense]|nr:hypothetical protein [Dactylosporangium siamense]